MEALVILKALGVLGGFFVPSLTVNYQDGSDLKLKAMK